MHPEQIKAFRRMTGAQKIDVALHLYHSARAMKAAHLQRKHPEWSKREVDAEVRRIFMHARD